MHKQYGGVPKAAQAFSPYDQVHDDLHLVRVLLLKVVDDAGGVPQPNAFTVVTN